MQMKGGWRRLIVGDHGRVYVSNAGRVTKEIREIRGTPKLNVMALFYAHKIADALFPGHFVTYSFARKKIIGIPGRKPLPSVLVSKLVPTTREHRAYVRQWYYHEQFGREMKRLVELANAHKARTDYSSIRPLYLDMCDAGIGVNTHPANIDVIGGKLFFFEVRAVDPNMVERAIPRHPQREKILCWLGKYAAACSEDTIHDLGRNPPRPRLPKERRGQGRASETRRRE